MTILVTPNLLIVHLNILKQNWHYLGTFDVCEIMMRGVLESRVQVYVEMCRSISLRNKCHQHSHFGRWIWFSNVLSTYSLSWCQPTSNRNRGVLIDDKFSVYSTMTSGNADTNFMEPLPIYCCLKQVRCHWWYFGGNWLKLD